MKLHYTVFLFSILTCFSCQKDSTNGCCDTHYVDEEWNGHEIHIPNAISPNGDGVNDFFSINSDSTVRTKSLTIFRGARVLENIEYNDQSQNNLSWDGRTYIEGKYFYKAVIMDSNGNEKTYNGSVCLFKSTCPSEDCKFPVGFNTSGSGQFLCR